MFKDFIFILLNFCLLQIPAYSVETELRSFVEKIQSTPQEKKTPSIATNRQISCAPELRACLEKIQSIPEGKKLIDTVLQEGPIRINTHSPSPQFRAYWDADHRVIAVNYKNRSEGELIGSILFELHNAFVTKKYDELDHLASQGKISKHEYVRRVEYLEYKNSLMASAIAKKGIQSGIFQPTAHLHTYSSFEEHFHYQKIGGHSAWIARNYDNIARADRS